MAKDYSAITPDILKLSELCSGNSVINSEMYLEHKVFRGLRDLNGNGVLTGLTEVSDIQSFEIGEDGEKHPCRGRLFYRGINVEELVGGFIKDNRFGFEETTYLLLVRRPAEPGGTGQFYQDSFRIPHAAGFLCTRYHYEGAESRHDEYAGQKRSYALCI